MGSVWCAITRIHLIKQHQVISSLIKNQQRGADANGLSLVRNHQISFD